MRTNSRMQLMVYDSMTLSVAWDSEIILSGSILDFDKSDMHTLHRDDG